MRYETFKKFYRVGTSLCLLAMLLLLGAIIAVLSGHDGGGGALLTAGVLCVVVSLALGIIVTVLDG